MTKTTYRVTARGLTNALGDEIPVGTEFETDRLHPGIIGKVQAVKGGKAADDNAPPAIPAEPTKKSAGRPAKDKDAAAQLPGLPGLPGATAATSDAGNGDDIVLLRDAAKAEGVEVTANMTADELKAAIAEKKAG